MPIYNCSDYISTSIESILKQTYKYFEFIIIDDCSTDNTISKISEYQDSRIVLIKNKTRKGICDCLNYGISISSGKYIVRMDGDDISHLSRFEHQVLFMEENPAVGVLGTWYKIHGTNEIVRLPIKHDSIVLDMLEYSPLAHPTVFIRASLIKDLIVVYNSQFVYAEDYELWSRLILKTQVNNLPTCLLEYRRHENQTSSLYYIEQKSSAKQVRLRLLKLLLIDFEIDLNSRELKEYLDNNLHNFKSIADLLIKFDKLLIGNQELKLFNQFLLQKKLALIKLTIVKYLFRRQGTISKIKNINIFISVLLGYYKTQFLISKI